MRGHNPVKNKRPASGSGASQTTASNAPTAKSVKAQRRELQERQRAEKAAARSSTQGFSGPSKKEANAVVDASPSAVEGSSTKDKWAREKDKFKEKGSKSGQKSENGEDNKQVALFAHLDKPKGANTEAASKEIHPAVLVLGLQFAELRICGSNARCIATLTAFKKVIQDYKTPVGTTLTRHLPTHLSPQINYLANARPMSVGMRNAIRHLKWEISTIDIDLSEDEAKQLLCEKIEYFIRDRITVADRVIIEYGMQKVQDGDVILTYARSSVVQSLLLEAHAEGIAFSVIVVDSRPLLEGKKLLRKLVEAGIPCTYALLHALGFALRDVSKVFLGAHAFTSNGALYSRVGTAMVAMTAKDMSIPVIVCCETYKFTDRVQLDSFVINEQGKPEDLVNVAVGSNSRPGALSGWLEQQDLKLLNLVYDLTPSKYISMVITEVGMIPCTSIPVILREYKPMLQ